MANIRVDANDAFAVTARFGGVVLLVGSLAAICFAFFLMLYNPKPPFFSNVTELLSFYFPQLLLFAAGLFLALVGVHLLKVGGVRTREVIPQQDAPLLVPLVSAGNSKAIDEYVRLSSLSGFTGAFTKLGLTGLPLTTISVTLFFALLYLVKGEQGKDFLDLTKLTLGAFIGSFVQRQTEREALFREVAKQARQDGDGSTGGPASSTTNGTSGQNKIDGQTGTSAVASGDIGAAADLPPSAAQEQKPPGR